MSQRPAVHSARSRRPSLEALEDRRLLSGLGLSLGGAALALPAVVPDLLSATPLAGVVDGLTGSSSRSTAPAVAAPAAPDPTLGVQLDLDVSLAPLGVSVDADVDLSLGADTSSQPDGGLLQLDATASVTASTAGTLLAVPTTTAAAPLLALSAGLTVGVQPLADAGVSLNAGVGVGSTALALATDVQLTTAATPTLSLSAAVGTTDPSAPAAPTGLSVGIQVGGGSVLRVTDPSAPAAPTGLSVGVQVGGGSVLGVTGTVQVGAPASEEGTTSLPGPIVLPILGGVSSPAPSSTGPIVIGVPEGGSTGGNAGENAGGTATPSGSPGPVAAPAPSGVPNVVTPVAPTGVPNVVTPVASTGSSSPAAPNGPVAASPSQAGGEKGGPAAVPIPVADVLPSQAVSPAAATLTGLQVPLPVTVTAPFVLPGAGHQADGANTVAGGTSFVILQNFLLPRESGSAGGEEEAAAAAVVPQGPAVVPAPLPPPLRLPAGGAEAGEEGVAFQPEGADLLTDFQPQALSAVDQVFAAVLDQLDEAGSWLGSYYLAPWLAGLFLAGGLYQVARRRRSQAAGLPAGDVESDSEWVPGLSSHPRLGG